MGKDQQKEGWNLLQGLRGQGFCQKGTENRKMM